MTGCLYVSLPHAMTNAEGARTGMAMEVWQRLAEVLAFQNDYTTFNSFAEPAQATSAGTVDVAVSNLTTPKSVQKS